MVRAPRRALPFVGLNREQWERLGDAAAWLALALVVAISSLAVYRYYGHDFRGYYAAARVALAGGDPYDYGQVAQVLLDTTGYEGNNPYYYPPWFCLIVMPLALLPWNAARAVWIAASWGLMLGGLVFLDCALGWRLRGWQRGMAWLSAFYLFGWVCLKFEQAGILVFFCLAWALWALRRGKDAQAGLAMALLLTKPNVTLLALAFLAFAWGIRRKALAWTLLWLGVLAGVGTLFLPGWLARLWEPGFGRGLNWLMDGPERVVSRRRLATLPHWLATWGIKGPLVWILYAVLAAGSCWWAYKSQRLRSDPVYAAAFGGTLTLLLTPYALMYDDTVLAVGLLWGYWRLGQGVSGWQRWLAMGILGFMSTVPFWARLESDGYWLALVMGALLVLLGAGNIEAAQFRDAL